MASYSHGFLPHPQAPPMMCFYAGKTLIERGQGWPGRQGALGGHAQGAPETFNMWRLAEPSNLVTNAVAKLCRQKGTQSGAYN